VTRSIRIGRRPGAGVWPAALLALASGLAPAAAAEPLPVTEIAPGLFVAAGVHAEADATNLGAIANVGFIVGDAAVAVIDTGGSAANGRRLRAAVRRVTELPIRHVVNTHVHPDHLLGNAAFRADRPDFIGHANLPRAMAARGDFYLEAAARLFGPAIDGTEVVPPTVTVRDRLAIDLGRRRLVIAAYPTAHTDTDLTVYDENTGTLWLSDLLFMERTPVVDGSLLGWLAVMDGLDELAAARVVPGHGPVSAAWPAALAPQRRYLGRLADEIRALQVRNGTIEEAMRAVGRAERRHWRLFDTYNPRNVAAAFTELEWE
jgi:quinoprotein relay system zinc metallohydrolase 2